MRKAKKKRQHQFISINSRTNCMLISAVQPFDVDYNKIKLNAFRILEENIKMWTSKIFLAELRTF